MLPSDAAVSIRTTHANLQGLAISSKMLFMCVYWNHDRRVDEPLQIVNYLRFNRQGEMLVSLRPIMSGIYRG